MTLAELLERYDRDLKPGDIDGDEFQNAVFVRMFRKLRISGLELCNFPEGEIDFALAKPDFDYITQQPTFDQWHLFECKNHNRPIEFATAAKLMLIGLRWQVHSINLVSRTALQRQAKAYAKTFFRLDEEIPKGGHAYPVERKIGGAGLTIFRHFITRDLIGFEIPPLSDAKPDQEASPRPNLTWTLIELQPYSERVLASSDDHMARIIVKANRYYRFEATVMWWSELKEPDCSMFDFPSGSITLCGAPSKELDASERVARLSALFRIDGKCLGSNLSLPSLALAAGNDFRWSQMPSAQLDVAGDAATPVSMRPVEQSKFNELFSDSTMVHLVVLTGEAGTGKTWLCDRLADERRAYLAWDALRFDALANASDNDLVEHMAVNVMLPARLRLEDGAENLARDIVLTLTGRNTDMPEAMRRETPIALYEFVSKSVVESEPRLLIVRNCERLSHVAARDLLDLVRAIERRGWGDVHIVLEGRDERSTDAWQWLRNELLSLDGVRIFPLEPMTRGAVDRWLDQVFESASVELKDICWSRARGYPLILQSLLECWQDRGAIERRASRWRILRPAVLREQIRSLAANSGPADKSEQVLVARLQGVAFPGWNLMSPFDDARFVLGLFAVAETPDRMVNLAEMLQLGDAIAILTTALRRADLLEAPQRELRFRHDRLREAAITMASMITDERKDALLERLPSGAELLPGPLELLGDLQLFAGEPNRAWVQYKIACDRAFADEAFLDACRIAAKQQDLHKRYGTLLSRPYIDYLQVIEARAWAEWNCGSLMAARELYGELIDEATRGADYSIDPTIAHAVVSHAAGRLVGIYLDLADVDAFIDSATLALRGHQDAGDFNGVMNRLVLACGQFGLAQLGKSLTPLLLAFAGLRQGEDRWQAELESVAAGVVGSLYFDAMPTGSLPVLHEAVAWSRGPRQRLATEIDLLAAQFLATGSLDIERARCLRSDAVRQGVYSVLAQIDILRSADALLDYDINEAKRLLDEAAIHINIQGQSCYSIALANNFLICALSSNDAPLIDRWSRELARLVEGQLEGRERLIGPLSKLLVPLATGRAERLRDRYSDVSPLSLDIPDDTPQYCGSLFVAWFNLRRLGKVDAASSWEAIELIRRVTIKNVSAIDVSAAESAFEDGLRRCGIRCAGTVLAFCLE